MKASTIHAIKVDAIHTLHIEEWGNPQGLPVVYLHGGPGGAISERCLQFFDLEKQYVILFDQRGCGKSTPFVELKDNDIAHSVADMEVIRQTLGIEQWVVFGGSYGSTLALCYAIEHPERVKHLVLRGVFLGRKEDIDWLFQNGAGDFYPEQFSRFQQHIAPEKQADLVSAYYELLTHEEDSIRQAAAIAWANWESEIVTLLPSPQSMAFEPWKMSIALLECHYFVNRMFWEKDTYILDHIDTLANIPMDIVHGRYDVDCRPIGAYLLAKACPQARLHYGEAAGHSPYDIANLEKLQEIMRNIV